MNDTDANKDLQHNRFIKLYRSIRRLSQAPVQNSERHDRMVQYSALYNINTTLSRFSRFNLVIEPLSYIISSKLRQLWQYVNRASIVLQDCSIKKLAAFSGVGFSSTCYTVFSFNVGPARGRSRLAKKYTLCSDA